MPEILVVDDEALNVEVIRRHLAPLGFGVTGAASAEEGLALLASRPFDAVILDIVLPGMSGLQALSELGRAGAPILVITGHADAEIEKDARLLGAAGFLAKPLDFEELRRILESVLNGAKR